MTFLPKLDQMTPEQLRALAERALQLRAQVDTMSKKRAVPIDNNTVAAGESSYRTIAS